MPNIRQQIVGPLGDKAPSILPGDQVGIYIQASDGREVTITKAQLRARFLLELGSRAVRRAATISWWKSEIVNALGAEQVPLTTMEADFDDGDGTPTRLEVVLEAID